MPEQVPFAAERRTVMRKKVKRLRQQGLIPANIFGRHRASLPIQINGLEFNRFLRRHAPTTLIRLTLSDGVVDTALVRHVEHDPRTGDIVHVDFMHIEMNEPIRARIPVRLEGEAPAVKLSDGVLLQLADTVEVEALPGALPDVLTVDVSHLEHLNDAVHVSDLHVPPGVKVLTDEAELLAKVEPPRVVEAVEVPVAATEAAQEEAAKSAAEEAPPA
jgi:large subunit ribosomal protein L25